MRKFGLLVVISILALALGASVASAQLGTTDNSSFRILNLGAEIAHVQVTFYDATGVAFNPATLNTGKSNPFSLDPGTSFEVYTPGIPSGLPNGRYSVVISSDQPIAATSNLLGVNGAISFNGSYSGVTSGSTSYFLPAVYHGCYSWNDIISVQNVGSGATNITVKYFQGATQVAMDSKTDLAPYASVHFDLKASVPSGMPSTFCGSAVVESTAQPVAVIDNQRTAAGNTQSYNGFPAGATKVYLPALYSTYYTWFSSLAVQNVSTLPTTVYVSYTDGTSRIRALAAKESVLFSENDGTHLPNVVAGATITATQPIVAVANAANPKNQAQTYSAFLSGGSRVDLPTIMKKFYNWDTSFTVMNVGTADASVTVTYAPDAANGFAGSTYSVSVLKGQSKQIYVPGDTHITSAKYGGSVTLSTATADASLVATCDETLAANQTGSMGDWSMSYNGVVQ
jgi:hypothetical protein